MGIALYATFVDRDRAEQTVGALLEAGVIPEDISLITRLQEAVDVCAAYEPALLMVDAGRANLAEIRYGSVSHEEEGSELYESQVGGGIATVEPDDDVSGPEEMDDSESVTEDLVQPAKGASFGSEEFRDADSFARYGSLNALRPRTVSPRIAEIQPVEEISAIAEFGLLILGDGHLALALLESTVDGTANSPNETVYRALLKVGVPEESARSLSLALQGRGAILSVVESVGAVPIEQIEAIIESSEADSAGSFAIEIGAVS